jgi:enoyl-CoA hydratase/carnithine racemase
MSEEGIVQLREDEKYYTITINRPSKKNALTLAMYRTLVAHLKQAEANDNIHFIVIRGAGDCFTAGNDLMDFAQTTTFADMQPILQFLHALHRFPKPIIAVVTGEAIGIGTTLLLHCDYVIATDNATFQLPFSRLGLCPEFASSLLLPQYVGLRKATELLMLGLPYNATKAFDMGLLNQLVALSQLEDKLEQTIRHFQQIPLQALLATKQLLKRTDQQVVTDLINHEAREFGRLLQSETTQNIIASFLKKGVHHD